MSYTTLLTEIDGAVGIITLNRADRHNAFDDLLRDELAEALNAVAANDAVRVLVLSATGKSFCAGADPGWLRDTVDYSEADHRHDADTLARLLDQLDRFPKPTIARVQGPAFGVGVGLVAACDVAVATYDTQFALPETRQGLLSAEVSPYLAAAIGARHARRYLLTAARFSAAEAYRLGLVHEIVGDESLLDEAVGEVIEQLLKGAPGAQAGSKALLRQLTDAAAGVAAGEPPAAWSVAQRCSEEGRAGVAATVDKHKPYWQSQE